MLLVNYKINAEKGAVLGVLRDNDRVVNAENYDLTSGKPRMHIKEKGNLLKIKCEMTEHATKDNGFLEGTYFLGGIKEENGRTSVSGVIVTCPIYHAILFAIFVYFIVQCFIIQGFSPIPIILIVFNIFMCKEEFKKQPLIKQYIFRTMKIVFAEKSEEVKRCHQKAEKGMERGEE